MKWEKRKPDRIHLSPPEKESLIALAEKFDCFAGTGKSAGSPSYRVLIQKVAAGDLKLSDPKAPKLFINFKFAPKWWKPDASNSMPAEDVAKKFKTTVEVLEEKGFILEGDRLRAKWKPYFFKMPKFLKSRCEPWWNPLPDSTMPVADAMRASKLTVEQLVASGLIEDEELGLILVPDEWSGWQYGGPREIATPPSISAPVETETEEIDDFKSNLRELT